MSKYTDLLREKAYWMAAKAFLDPIVENLNAFQVTAQYTEMVGNSDVSCKAETYENFKIQAEGDLQMATDQVLHIESLLVHELKKQ